MQKRFITTENPNMIRDLNSKALIIKDDIARKEYENRMREKRKTDEQINQIKQTINEINLSITTELDLIKQMILELANKQ
jgi:hypothetical protein